MRTLLLIIGASLLAGSWPLAVGAGDQAPGQLDEVVVTGERTGPGLWHVHRGAAQMWVLGSISPLPKGITWRATEVEKILGSTDRVLVPKPLEIGIVRILWLLVTERNLIMVRGGKRLRDVLPPDLGARFALDRSKYTSDTDKWEHFRPIVAAAFLQQAAFHQVGLSARIDLGAAVRSLAKKHDVRVEEVKIAGVGDVLEALKNMPPATENMCVQASLVTVEKDLPRLMDRARAWSTGNVERIESLPEPAEVDACLAALDSGAAAGDLIGRVRRAWLESMQKYLQAGGTTLAVVNMDLLLGRGGLLDALRAQGYEVEAP
ncbi:MAG: TraB/GumN family protein [Steroidobacteraceae bacterium]|jgi:uncharacterized protein YbaP (TraB family)